MQIPLFSIFIFVQASPAMHDYDMYHDIEEQLHGFIVEGDIPENPEDVQYPHPEFVAPLFIDEGNGHLHLLGSNPLKCGLAGYVPAEHLEGRLMDLDQFKKNYVVPDEARFKLIENAEPIFDIKE